MAKVGAVEARVAAVNVDLEFVFFVVDLQCFSADLLVGVEERRRFEVGGDLYALSFVDECVAVDDVAELWWEGEEC